MPALPFTIALGRPSRSELLSVAGAALLVGSVAAWVITSAHHARPQPAADPPTGSASVEVGQRTTGRRIFNRRTVARQHANHRRSRYPAGTSLH